MKIGDKVRVTDLDYDERGTGLKIGDIGEVSAEHAGNSGADSDLFKIRFEKQIPAGTTNLNDDGTYDMFRCQLELMEEAL